MKIVCIVQARLNSTRLPRKVLLPLAGKPMLWNILERIQRAKMIDQIVVTCPVNDVMEIAPAVPEGIFLDPFLGDENDLVARHLQAATWAKADLVVRIPSDNVAVDPAYIDQAVTDYQNRPYVFYSNTLAYELTTDWLVDGFGAEVFSLSRLKWLDEKTRGHQRWREHPHQYFYDLDGWAQNESLGMLKPDEEDCIHRLDVNTQADYEFIQDIYNHFGHNRFTSAEVVAYLERTPVQA